MPQPNVPANLIPGNEATQLRRVEDMERAQRETLPAVMAAIRPMFASIREALEAAQSAIAQVQAQQAQLAAQQAQLSAAVADLAARVTVTNTAATFNTGALPNDATFHAYGPDIPVTVNCPTGRMVITVGCGEASLNAGGASVVAEATFGIAGMVGYGEISSRAFLGTSLTVNTSNSLAVTRSLSVAPGTYTVVGKMRAWAGGTASASVNFQSPYLTVQVTG